MEKIHYRKARNSDYLAGTDLEIFELEGKSKKLTISKVEYKENFRVNGKMKPKGLIVYFEEDYAKPLIVNTTNSEIIKQQTGMIDASRWVGFTVEFYFNMDVQMKVSRTETIKGGIRIKSVNSNGLVPDIADIDGRIDKAQNKAELMAVWRGLSESEQINYKDKMNTKYKTL